VTRDVSAHEQFEQRVAASGQILGRQLEIDPEIALQLIKGGLNSLEAIAEQADATDIMDILSISQKEAEDLQAVAAARLKSGK
jgi:hypothetical protein